MIPEEKMIKQRIWELRHKVHSIISQTPDKRRALDLAIKESIKKRQDENAKS